MPPPESGRQPRAYCLECRRPAVACLCPSEPPMATRTRIALLTHPKEARRTKCGTGRLTRINLADCEIIIGVDFDDSERYRLLVEDPANYPVLVYPGDGAVDLRDPAAAAALAAELDGGFGGAGGGAAGGLAAGRTGGGRRLVAFMIDATWPISRTVLKASASLNRLPRIKFDPASPSRFTIKRQPNARCLSTLEAVHELLLALERAGLESYPDKRRLLDVFARMQDFQIACLAEAGTPRFKPAPVLPHRS